MSTHHGATGRLSEHDGEIIEVFTPRRQKIGPSTAHTQQSVGLCPHACTFTECNKAT